MESNRFLTGSEVLDNLLNGGYEPGIITTFYGPSSSGKTCFCLLAAIQSLKSGKKIIFVDTEGGFSIDRAVQLFPEFKSRINNILFLHPTNFEEQKNAFEKLKNFVDDEIGLIVVDSISMLYRLEFGKNENRVMTNRELGRQLAHLTEIARKKNIPIIVTNQVYSNFDERDKVNMVGGDILKYSSKCLVELKKAGDKRKAILKKHRSLPESKEINFIIKEEGVF